MNDDEQSTHLHAHNATQRNKIIESSKYDENELYKKTKIKWKETCDARFLNVCVLFDFKI